MGKWTLPVAENTSNESKNYEMCAWQVSKMENKKNPLENERKTCLGRKNVEKINWKWKFKRFFSFEEV